MVYNIRMVKIRIDENDGNQRLDRFLKKYYDKAPLSLIYKMIRKDIKVNGKRVKEETVLMPGDELTVFILESQERDLRSANDDVKPKSGAKKAKRQFRIVFEDENILIVDKPFGLLTHGDSREKKNHLANQVIDYLIEQGQYDPRKEKTFTPAPANRLDRNTTGLVIFAKNAGSLRELNRMIRERDCISKCYLTIVNGNLKKEVDLVDRMIKDEEKNVVSVMPAGDGEGKLMETKARPLSHGRRGNREYTLCEVEILTGRTHQIRAQLASIGHPLLGDSKYGRAEAARSTQLLHSYKLEFKNPGDGVLNYLKGKVITCDPPAAFTDIQKKIFENY